MNQNVGAQNPPGGEYAQRRGTQVHELEPSALLCRRDKFNLNLKNEILLLVGERTRNQRSAQQPIFFH